MNQAQLFDYCEKTFQKMLLTIRAKNTDYAGASESGLHNFLMVEHLGITSAEVGMMTRMSDKFSRLGNLIGGNKKGAVDESVEDTLLDLANYCVLLTAILQHRKLKGGANAK